MKIQLVSNTIESHCKNYDIIVLKGFTPNEILSIGNKYNLLDREFFEGDKIVLEKMLPQTLMLKFLTDTRKSIMTFESLIFLSTQFKDIKALGKKICILDNNLIRRYLNPSTTDIPDYDSPEFQNNTSNKIYSVVYAYCEHENDKQYVTYILPDFDNPLDVFNLYDQKSIKTIGDLKNARFISLDNGAFDDICEQLNSNESLSETEFYIDSKEASAEEFALLNSAASVYGYQLTFCAITVKPQPNYRSELQDLLKDVWGYDDFRFLDIYDNLPVSHSIKQISQGEVIENVIRQSEIGVDSDDIRNIILTSPTGAGKSLLFQMSAIYLAKKYGYLTIVISPLLALMEDQVNNLKPLYPSVAALNSFRSPSEKEEILEGIKNGKINLLYLAPELLLSYSISTFISNRHLGLFVIDEAHTVTTWGRDFRVDYWFLGDYLKTVRRYISKECGYSFPTFALTATAVWDNHEDSNDMVFDTIASLDMSPCLQFIGVVKRKNISFDIKQSDISKNYYTKRNTLTCQRIKEFVENESKAVVYFPYKSDASYFGERHKELESVSEFITSYHSELTSNQKNDNLDDFKKGVKYVICATKAFGMGVDVPDIKVVYHHAPSGGLTDYVQEVGRAARDQSIQGIAKLDFCEEDFRYNKKLHGLSGIKHWQVRAVLRKLISLFRMGGEKRNMLISADDFSYIFDWKKKDKDDNNDLDQKVKSTLMLISHDLSKKLNFPSLIVRPKNLFTRCYIRVSPLKSLIFQKCYSSYLEKIDEVKGLYIVNLDKLWNDKFNDFSFGNFKMRLATGKELSEYKIQILCKINTFLNFEKEVIKNRLTEFFDTSESLISTMKREGRTMKKTEVKSLLSKKYGKDWQFIYEAFKKVYVNDNKESFLQVKEFYRTPERSYYQFIGGAFEKPRSLYLANLDMYINNQQEEFYRQKDDKLVKLLELMQILNLADYTLQGGDNPMIFVMINNPYYLSQLAKGNRYTNTILEGIYKKYELSEKIMTYFFTTPMSNEQRWDFIEAYFLGATEEQLLNFV